MNQLNVHTWFKTKSERCRNRGGHIYSLGALCDSLCQTYCYLGDQFGTLHCKTADTVLITISSWDNLTDPWFVRSRFVKKLTKTQKETVDCQHLRLVLFVHLSQHEDPRVFSRVCGCKRKVRRLLLLVVVLKKWLAAHLWSQIYKDHRVEHRRKRKPKVIQEEHVVYLWLWHRAKHSGILW